LSLAFLHTTTVHKLQLRVPTTKYINQFVM